MLASRRRTRFFLLCILLHQNLVETRTAIFECETAPDEIQQPHAVLLCAHALDGFVTVLGGLHLVSWLD